MLYQILTLQVMSWRAFFFSLCATSVLVVVGLSFYSDPRLTAEILGAAAFAGYWFRVRSERLAVADDRWVLQNLAESFSNIVEAEVAAKTDEIESRSSFLEQELCEKNILHRKTIARLDATGMFVSACVELAIAETSGDYRKVDRAWNRIEKAAADRWPDQPFSKDLIASAVDEVTDRMDMSVWRRLVNSEYGLVMEIEHAKV